MIQKLIILGSLKNNPSSGYDIKKFIEKELGIFSALKTRSIYYPLKKMEKDGVIKKKEIKGKKLLKKYIYSITPKGEKSFIKLSNQALRSEKRPFIDIDVPLYFLPYLDKKETIARLRLQKRFLAKVKEWLEDKLGEKEKFPPHQRVLLKHHFDLSKLQEDFVKDFIEVIKSYPDKKKSREDIT